MQGASESVFSFAGKAAIGIGALVVGVSAIISSLAKGAAESAAAVSNSATQFGLTVDAYQRLRQVADDANISVDGLNHILGNVDSAATQAAAGLQRIVPAGNLATRAIGGIGPIANESISQLGTSLAVAQQSISGSIDLIQKFGDKTVTILNGVSRSQLETAKSSETMRGGTQAAANALAQLGLSADVLRAPPSTSSWP
jgi:methyl-accepting chemotaxis protein